MSENGNSNPGKGLQVAGFVLGILALVFGIIPCFWIPPVLYLTVSLGILGIVLSAVGRSKSKKASASTGLGTAGLVMSIIGITLFPLLLSLIVGGFAAAASSIDEEDLNNFGNGIEQIDEDIQQLGEDLEQDLQEQGE